MIQYNAIEKTVRAAAWLRPRSKFRHYGLKTNVWIIVRRTMALRFDKRRLLCRYYERDVVVQEENTRLALPTQQQQSRYLHYLFHIM